MYIYSLNYLSKLFTINKMEDVMDDKKYLGLKIRALRKSKNLTQEKLSEIIEISPRQMVKIEMGQIYPSIEVLKKIAEVFEISVQNLFDNEYYDDITSLKEKLHSKIDAMDERNIRFLYLISSNLETI